ncbi:MAG TPA: DUF1236 domain-containing protein [Stellaceae bacterium]|nr:DUF1236 domain-containing protein [Stellaceae bacterium]
MKRIVLATALALVAAPAFAQSMTETKTVTTTTIAPAEETEMRQYVVREHRPMVPPPAGFTVTTGAVLPEAIQLYTFPAERHWRYEYATIGDQTVLVDPGTRRVVHILH